MKAITPETLIEEGKHIMEWLDPLLTEEDILQLTIVQKMGQQALEQGREEGREEGTRQEAMSLLLRTLPRLLGELPADLVTHLQPYP